MTQLLVPMTYAEKLEQELIQVERERDRYLVLLMNLTQIGDIPIQKFPEELARDHLDGAIRRASTALENRAALKNK